MYQRISDSFDNHEYSIGIFVDLSKAFDTINHKILLSKLQYYGVRGLALNWFKDYLRNRIQFVEYNNIASSVKYISCGVPQGSLLDPLLFMLYVNDVQNCSTMSRRFTIALLSCEKASPILFLLLFSTVFRSVQV